MSRPNPTAEDWLEYFDSTEPSDAIRKRIADVLGVMRGFLCTQFSEEYIARCTIHSISRRVLIFFVNFLVRHRMLHFPLLVSSDNENRDSRTTKCATVRCDDNPNSLYEDKGHTNAYKWSLRLLFSRDTLSLLDSLLRGERGVVEPPTIYIVHEPGVEHDIRVFDDRGIRPLVISFGRVASAPTWEMGYTTAQCNFHVKQVFQVLCWMLKEVINHPSEIADVLLDRHADVRSFLAVRLRALEEKGDPHLRMKREFCGFVCALHTGLPMSGFDLWRPNKVSPALMAGLNCLLAYNHKFMNVHNHIRLHSSMWTEDLRRWVAYEHESGCPSMLNDELVRWYRLRKRDYYALVLPGFNVFRFLHQLRVRIPTGAFVSMYDHAMIDGVARLIGSGEPVPFFRDREYLSTDIRAMGRIIQACQRAFSTVDEWYTQALLMEFRRAENQLQPVHFLHGAAHAP